MSPARNVRERGTWQAIATVAIAFAVCAGNIGGAWDAPLLTPVAAQASPKEPKGHDVPVKKPVEKNERKRKPKRRKASVEDMIRDEFGRRADEALLVARCESKLDPAARNRSGATGVFQIMPVHRWRVAKVRSSKDLSDARTNVRVARHLHRSEGWRPWVCARILGLTT